MPEFVTNLLRRGAGLAPMVSARLPAEMEGTVSLAEEDVPEVAAPSADRVGAERNVGDTPAPAPAVEQQLVERVVKLREVEAVIQPAVLVERKFDLPATLQQPESSAVEESARFPPPVAANSQTVADSPESASPPESLSIIGAADVPLVRSPSAELPPTPVPQQHAEQPPVTEKTIEVRIGRIEIRQPAPPAAQQPQAPRRQAWVFGGNPLARRYLDRRWY